ncbi:MAG: hypothetical protein M1820_007475 [Bogoriella megaspora]|nr:MAG: hypothetical protein M1820_007475 [Bogoriella megaspora]
MPVLREVGAGIQLSPNATQLFKAWGISEAVEEEAYKPEEGTLYSYRGHAVAKTSSGIAVERAYGAPYLVIHRADLLNVLLAKARASGVQILLGSNVVSLDLSAPSITLADGKVYSGDVILGADGERSSCRDALFGYPDLPQATGDIVYRVAVPGRNMLETDLTRHLLHKPSVNLWMGPDSHTVSYILRKDNILNVVLICPDKAAKNAPFGPQRASVEELQEAFCNWDPVFTALLHVPGSELAKWSLLEIKEVSEWVHPEGRFALVGDAAHAMLPYLAQGAAQAFEDAGVLGTLFRLIEDPSHVPDVLRIYEKMRKPRAREIRNRTLGQKKTYGLQDGPRQEERDIKLAADVPIEGHPNALEDPVFQKWLWGYDAISESENAWRSFLQESKAISE